MRELLSLKHEHNAANPIGPILLLLKSNSSNITLWTKALPSASAPSLPNPFHAKFIFSRRLLSHIPFAMDRAPFFLKWFQPRLSSSKFPFSPSHLPIATPVFSENLFWLRFKWVNWASFFVICLYYFKILKFILFKINLLLGLRLE